MKKHIYQKDMNPQRSVIDIGRLLRRRGEEPEPEYQQPVMPPPIPKEYQQAYDERLQEQYPQEYYEEQYPEEYYEQPYYEERPEIQGDAPIHVLNEIKQRPSQPHAFETIIQGIPIDLHALENYVLKISPYAMTTILRYRTIRTLEESRNLLSGNFRKKMGGNVVILIILALGMGVLGILMIFFMPQIMAFFKGGF